jgi:probable F420-dependent oxidoreductase
VQLGAVYPQTELGGSPDAVRRIGALLEQVGYDHLLAYDHVVGASHEDRTPPLGGPYGPEDPFHDPFVLFAYLAGRTERLRFATGVLVLPQRQTVLVAKQAADLAVLSGDRLRLGVGVGWNPVEYQALGASFGSRGRRAEEQIPLLRRLWSEPLVSFHGDFDVVDRAALLPRPRAPIPVWLGGFGDVAARRAAALADGFVFTGASVPSGGFDHRGTAERWSAVRAAVERAGRSPEAFGGELIVRHHRNPRDAIAAAEWWADLGGTHVAIATLGLGFDSVDAHLDYFGAVAEAMSSARGAS